MFIQILTIFDKAQGLINIQDILAALSEKPQIIDEENNQGSKVRCIYSFHQAGLSLSINEDEKLCKAMFYVQKDEIFKKFVDHSVYFNNIDTLDKAEKTLGKPTRQLSKNDFIFYYFQTSHYWQVLKFSLQQQLLTLSIFLKRQLLQVSFKSCIQPDLLARLTQPLFNI